MLPRMGRPRKSGPLARAHKRLFLRKSDKPQRFFMHVLLGDPLACGVQPSERRAIVPMCLQSPMIDRDSVWKYIRPTYRESFYLLVSHTGPWSIEAELQATELARVAGDCVDVVVRDAVWDMRLAIKQVFVMGLDVPRDKVLALPYDFFEMRCSQPRNGGGECVVLSRGLPGSAAP